MVGRALAINRIFHQLEESIIFEEFFELLKFSDRDLDGDHVLIFVEDVVFGEGLHSVGDDPIKV